MSSSRRLLSSDNDNEDYKTEMTKEICLKALNFESSAVLPCDEGK